MSVPVYTDAEKAAELGIVGAALARPEIVHDIALEAEHFADGRLGRVWSYLQAMAAEGAAIEPMLVADRLERAGYGRQLALLSQAELQASIFPRDAAAVVRQGWVTRRVVFAAGEVVAAQREGTAGEELLSLALAKLAGIDLGQLDKTRTIGEIARDRFVEIGRIAEERARGLPATSGIPTGIAALDEVISGLQLGICTVVAARPGMGKSSFGLTVADHASSLGIGVHVFNMEDGESAYADRSLSRRSLVPSQSLRNGDVGRVELAAVAQAVDDLGRVRNWIVDDRGGLKAEELIRSVRRERKANGTRLVIVDYVQLLRGSRRMDRTEVLTDAMEQLGDAAKQDGIAYLVMAQLNRDCEKRENKRPLASDLKQSGALEERAKAVIALYRPHVYRERDPDSGELIGEDVIEILVRKFNGGQTGRVIARWHGPTTRIE